MENQSPTKAGKQPFVEPVEPKTLSKELYKQARAAAAEAEMQSLLLQMKLERGMSKGESSASAATKVDHQAAGTQPNVPFPWPA